MKIGRNAACPCGSGKKYKNCCMNKERSEISEQERKLINGEIDEEMLSGFMHNFHRLFLKNKPHIKEYEKIRKLHGEIIDSMMEYYDSGKFKLKFTTECSIQEIKEDKDAEFINSKFDTNTQLGAQAMANLVIYKNSKNMSCITEDFINKNKYRKLEKMELLDSMLNSVAGLFEIVNTDRNLGQVQMRNVLTNKEYCVTDISLSSNFHNEKYYFYTRIITYKNVSLGTGLNIIFDKEDIFIRKWIEKNIKEYDKKEELQRFLEVYNEYNRNNKGIKASVYSY